jgi:hypothetical membrane protein
MTGRRALALGGALGPAAFVTTWSVLGATAAGYSPVHESISQLAATDASTRGAMAAGVVAFGIGVPLYAVALRDALPGRAWALAAVAGVATLGVAAFPLGSPANDAAHRACVAVAYLALPALPIVAAGALRRQKRVHWSMISTVTGVVTGALLLGSLVTSRTGLLQRAGLVVVDVWIVATALDILRRR